jgi:uncharacterized protein YndB with AHSA1/START domain
MIDVDEQLGAVTRTVGEREVDGRRAKAVTMAQTYATDLEDLWDAVTSAERISRWMMPITGELRPGGRYQLEGNAGGTITACDPPHGFEATWEYAETVSWIEVRLVAVDDDHARLELTHLAYPDEHWEQFGPAAGGIGWDLALLGLSLHLDGHGDRPPEADAWPGTPDGVAFITGSGQAWGEAHIVDGQDEAAARAAAERTVAAYTQPPTEP